MLPPDVATISPMMQSPVVTSSWWDIQAPTYLLENAESVFQRLVMEDSVGVFVQLEEIGSISSRLYVAEKTMHRILDLYLSTANVSPRKQ